MHAAFDRFEIVQPLATGGMSEVFLARDRAGEAGAPLVVVKKLFAHFAAQPVLAARFRHEAALLGALAHAGVPRLIAHGAAGDTLYLAQTRAPGRGLDAVLADAGGAPSPIARAVALARALLGALAHVHTREGAAGAPLAIVHRDVTPANVFVAEPDGARREPAVSLIDFGIATSALHPRDAGDARGGVRGTPGYTAPEAITGEHAVDARADLFAVGVILHELLTGRRLYPGGALAAMCAVTSGVVPAVRDARPDCPRALEDIVLRALAREPGARFASAGEMARALGTVFTS